MNILVTGANGQLAQCLKWIVESNTNGEKGHFVGEKNYYIFKTKDELNISVASAVKNFVKENFINVIVNCAAYTDVNKAQTDRVTATLVNLTGPKNLAEAAKENGAVLIHFSTDYVFSAKNGINTPLPPYDFTSPSAQFRPVSENENFYGYSKLEGEKAIINSGCKYLIFRTSWLYSWYGKNFVKTMFDKIIEGEDVKVVYDQVGSPTSAHELARFIYYLIEKNNSENRFLSKTGIYNFSERGVASWYDIVSHIKMCLKDRYDLEFYDVNIVTPCLSSEFPQPVVRPSYSVLDNSSIRKVFNYIPNYWCESLYHVIEYLFDKFMDEHKPQRVDSIETKKKDFENYLDAENTEFDFGHNVDYKNKEDF